MNDVLGWIAAFVLGILLGVFFFGGLWWTTSKTRSVRRPALWFIGSFFIRTALVMAGFWFIGSGQYQRLLISLGGFITGRYITNLWIGSLSRKQASPVTEEIHEIKS